ncbi:MAG: hypothetical protein JW744_02415 [Candidatus Diapherotrites archaeon]|uniref:Uncharacterized protein n=1 Tax=Candidatus Iainarchaeum sp. TaxID=3101447 RepID=A0A938YTM5_9ARCH|nr:hypothetical protein [Candidatus Diapherotrites archaeon]
MKRVVFVLGKKGEKDVLVCPQCGSTDLKWLLGGKLGDQYYCPKCSYQGFALRGNPKFVKGFKEK